MTLHLPCEKDAYSKSEAERILKRLHQEPNHRNKRLQAYKCPNCFKYHLTSHQKYEG